ncbi:MAG: hypothetical protein Q9186_001129 [Xanthomendoza sp. 1 TL-2023]
MAPGSKLDGLKDAKARASPPPEQAALATLHNIGASASEIPSSFRYHDLDALLLSPQPERNKGQVLFLQGFLPQDWVTAIGSKYDIKPDFFKRHLDFSSQSDHRNAFSLPSLPSTRDNHFELNINTIFCHSTTLAGDESGNSTQKCRMKQEEQLSTYRRQLRAHARGGDSLILLSLHKLTKQAAHDPLLALAPIFTHSAASEVQFLNLLEICIDEEVPQLEPERPHHASLENIQHFNHLLSRHAKQIRQCLRSVQLLCPGDQNSFPNSGAGPSQRRRSHRDELSRERTQVGSSDLNMDQDYESATCQTAIYRTATTTGVSLLNDYEDLLARCSELSARCTSAMDVTMNKALILESQKAIEQSERLKKLSLLATFFIPLSFTSSLFGMNFKVFGQGDLNIWLYAAVALPITIIPFLFYACDVRQMGQSILEWGDRRVHRGRKSPEMLE